MVCLHTVHEHDIVHKVHEHDIVHTVHEHDIMHTVHEHDIVHTVDEHDIMHKVRRLTFCYKVVGSLGGMVPIILSNYIPWTSLKRNILFLSVEIHEQQFFLYFDI